MNIKLYSPHDKQKLIHAACEITDPAFYIVVVAGRRAGKSMAAINQIIYWAMKYPKSKILYVTPSDEQGGNIIEEMIGADGFESIIKSRKNSKGSRELIFKNDSKITFKSSDSRSIRGLDSNFVVVDEAAYLNNKVFELDIQPTMAINGKKCLIISTPKGKNWFYKMYLKGLDKNEKNHKSFKFLSTDNPMAPKDLIEMFKSQVPEAVFRQEYEGSFEDSAGVFRNIDACCILNSANAPGPGEYYAGVDIGLLHDETVLTIINGKGEVVFMDRFTGLEVPELKERLLGHLRKWKPRRTLIEENNQGLPIIQDLKRVYNNITGFKTTNQSKEELINKLIAAFSSEEIKALNDEEMILQLNSFIFEMTESGKVRYCAASGFHDDIVMSLALAWSAYVKSEKTGGYQIFGADHSFKAKSNFGKFIEDNLSDNDDRLNGDGNNEIIFFGNS